MIPKYVKGKKCIDQDNHMCFVESKANSRRIENFIQLLILSKEMCILFKKKLISHDTITGHVSSS